MLSAAAAGTFRSVGGIVKAVFFFSYLVYILPRAQVQQDIWTGALRRMRAREEKGVPHAPAPSVAPSATAREFSTAGARGRGRWIEPAPTFTMYLVQAGSRQLLPCNFCIQQVNLCAQASHDLSSAVWDGV